MGAAPRIGACGEIGACVRWSEVLRHIDAEHVALAVQEDREQLSLINRVLEAEESFFFLSHGCGPTNADMYHALAVADKYQIDKFIHIAGRAWTPAPQPQQRLDADVLRSVLRVRFFRALVRLFEDAFWVGNEHRSENRRTLLSILAGLEAQDVRILLAALLSAG